MLKDQYRKFCEGNPDLPVFLQHWWLDAVCGENNWEFISTEDDSGIFAVWPFYFVKGKYGQNICKHPPLTPFLGPFINYPEKQKYCSRLALEKEVIFLLTERMPAYDVLVQNINSSITNILPFHWKGYNQGISYTYRIDQVSDLENIMLNFKECVRTDIKKASRKLEILETDDIDLFYRIYRMSFERQRIRIPHTLDFIKKVDKHCSMHGCRNILYARDTDNNIHGAIYLVRDNKCAYYLLGGLNHNHKNSGGMSLLIWEAIKSCAIRNQAFDFEGSTIPGVEHFFRNFGARQHHYIQISSYSRKGEFLRLMSGIKKLLRNK